MVGGLVRQPRHSPLGRLLFARDADGSDRPEGGRRADGRRRAPRGSRRSAASAPRLRRASSARRSGGPPALVRRRAPPGDAVGGRASTASSTGAGGAPPTATSPPAPTRRGVASEPEEAGRRRRARDGAAGRRPVERPGDRRRRCRVPSLLGDDAGRRRVGTFVHAVLEAARLRRGRPRRRAGGARGGGAGAAAGRARRPSGGRRRAARGARDAARARSSTACGCATSPRADRLDELELRAAAGRRRRPDGTADARRDRRRCCARTCPRTIRSPATPTGSRDPALRATRARLPDRQHRPRRCALRAAAFAVVDYKTNWLGAPGEPLTAWHYRPAALAAEMQRAPLRRCRRCSTPSRCTATCAGGCAGYDPAQHLAGVLYLFLRGMTGPDTPVVDGQPCGVFAWQPPAGARARR